jgi:hypothetical protein
MRVLGSKGENGVHRPANWSRMEVRKFASYARCVLVLEPHRGVRKRLGRVGVFHEQTVQSTSRLGVRFHLVYGQQRFALSAWKRCVAVERKLTESYL